MKKIADFTTRFHLLLEENHIARYSVGRKLGIPVTTMNEYYSGRYIPKAENLHKLADYFNVNYWWLLGYDVPKEKTLTIKQEIIDLMEKMSDEQLKNAMKILKVMIGED